MMPLNFTTPEYEPYAPGTEYKLYEDQSTFPLRNGPHVDGIPSEHERRVKQWSWGDPAGAC